MRKCPKCSYENADGVDHCANCGAYLRWEPTRLVSSIPAPPADAPAEPGADPSQQGTLGGRQAFDAAGATVTLVLPAAGAAAPPGAGAPAATPPSVRADQVLIHLRLAGSVGGGGGEVTPRVDPGGQASLIALIRNQSGIVDNYDVEVEGVPAEWWRAVPPTVYLVPFGSPAGSSEEEVELRFQPPRSAQAEARSWPIRVVVHSKTHDAPVGAAEATLQITPFEQLDSELRPEVTAGRRGATYALMVRNRANAPVEIVVTAKDGENRCTFEIDRPTFVADPGRRAGTTFAVRPKRQIWVGKTVDRRLEIVARSATDDTVARQHRAVFRQRPWVPRWALPLVVLAGAAAAAVIALLPSNTTVPPLRGKTPVEAAALLDKAGLKLSPEQPKEVRVRNVAGGAVASQLPKPGTKVKKGTLVTIVVAMYEVPKLLGKTQSQAQLLLQQAGLKLAGEITQRVSTKPPGTILAQTPGTGRRVATGTEVSIFVAVGSGLRTVPDLKELTVSEADAALRKSGLSMQVTLAKGQLPDRTRVIGQLPGAGAQIQANQPVTVIPKPPKTVKPTPLPDLAGMTLAEASAALQKRGIVPEEVRRFDPSAGAGAILAQIPPAGTTLKTGAKVQLFVSAGFPRIVFSNGKDLMIMSGADGSSPKPLAPTPSIEDEPAWQPDGKRIAYRRGPASNTKAGKIWIVESSGKGQPRRLTDGRDDRRPAFSPDGKVIAYAGSSHLCFVRVAVTSPAGACKGGSPTLIDRPAWSPDGGAILAVARDSPSANQTKLVEFTSTIPNSSRPSDWTQQPTLATDGLVQPGRYVYFAAFAPDGKQVAIVANWSSGDPKVVQIFLSPWSASGLGPPTALSPPLRACEVAWRPDSGELAVVSCDDGDIESVDPTKPAVVTTLRAGQNPAWEPLSVSGG